MNKMLIFLWIKSPHFITPFPWFSLYKACSSKARLGQQAGRWPRTLAHIVLFLIHVPRKFWLLDLFQPCRLKKTLQATADWRPGINLRFVTRPSVRLTRFIVQVPPWCILRWTSRFAFTALKTRIWLYFPHLCSLSSKLFMRSAFLKSTETCRFKFC